MLSCSNPIQIGMMAPFTGPAASIGDDQLHWAEFFARVEQDAQLKINIVQGDTQLIRRSPRPSRSRSRRTRASSASSARPVARRSRLSRRSSRRRASRSSSGSATNVALTDGKLKGYFFRVVPNDGVQGPTDADYMMTKLGVKKGATVMIVDDQESYSTGLADIVERR